MSRRKSDVTLHCLLTTDEADFAALMMAQTGIGSDSNLVRLALWHLAKHLDVRIGNEIFKMRPMKTSRLMRIKREFAAEGVS